MESSEAFSTAREELAGSATVLSTVHSMYVAQTLHMKLKF